MKSIETLKIMENEGRVLALLTTIFCYMSGNLG